MKLIVITLILAFSSCGALAADAAKPLHLLVITADDMNVDSGGWNGNTLGATPNLAADQPSIIRARDYLLKTQHADGSWLAESPVKFKAQPCFENGDPHGEHQFLSTAATAWATAGLAQLLPPKPTAPGP